MAMLFSYLSISHTKETHLGMGRIDGYCSRKRMGSHGIPLAGLDG
jgi:hypothetical protein